MNRQSSNRVVKRAYLISAFKSNSCDSSESGYDEAEDKLSESDGFSLSSCETCSYEEFSDSNCSNHDEKDCYLSSSETFYDESSKSSSSEEMSFGDELLLFFQTFNVSEKAMQFLLDACARHNVDAPRSLHALKKKEKNIHVSYEVEHFYNGNFSYIGIEESLKFAMGNCLIEYSHDSICEFEVIFNIDGLPLFKSSNISLWPILMKVDCLPRPLLVAVFVGNGKPNLDAFLEKFVNELKLFTKHGVICGGRLIKFKKILFACDAPAKSYICRVKGHNAKEACQYCDAVGEYTERRIVHSLQTSNRRSDENYASNTESNQCGVTPLLTVPNFGIYRSLVIDYQHAVCLGTVRKLFRLYFKDKARVSKDGIAALSDVIEQNAKHTPFEFKRRPRRINEELDHFR